MSEYAKRERRQGARAQDEQPAPLAGGQWKNEPYSGRPLAVSGALAQRISRGFGIDAGELALRESPEVTALGARAVAQGNSIRFAPGEFRPNTAEGMKTLGHELSHVVQQSHGGVRANVPDTNISLDNGLESAGDRAGEAFARGDLTAAAPVSLTGVSAWGAPAQGSFFTKIKKLFKRGKSQGAQEPEEMENPLYQDDMDQDAPSMLPRLDFLKNPLFGDDGSRQLPQDSGYNPFAENSNPRFDELEDEEDSGYNPFVDNSNPRFDELEDEEDSGYNPFADNSNPRFDELEDEEDEGVIEPPIPNELEETSPKEAVGKQPALKEHEETYPKETVDKPPAHKKLKGPPPNESATPAPAKCDLHNLAQIFVTVWETCRNSHLSLDQNQQEEMDPARKELTNVLADNRTKVEPILNTLDTLMKPDNLKSGNEEDAMWRAQAFDTRYMMIRSCLQRLKAEFSRGTGRIGKIQTEEPEVKTQIKSCRDSYYKIFIKINAIDANFPSVVRDERKKAAESNWQSPINWKQVIDNCPDGFNTTELNATEKVGGGKMSDVVRIDQGEVKGFFKKEQMTDLSEEDIRKRLLTDLAASGDPHYLAKKSGSFYEQMEKAAKEMDPAAFKEIHDLGFDTYRNLNRNENESDRIRNFQEEFSSSLAKKEIGLVVPEGQAEALDFFTEAFHYMGELYSRTVSYQNSRLSNNAAMINKQNLTQQNLNTSRLAELLGVQDLIAFSKVHLVKENNKVKPGVLMEEAKGTQHSKLSKEFWNTKKEWQDHLKIQQLSGEFVRQLISLEVLDTLTTQIDRHVDNYFVEYEQKDSYKYHTPKKLTAIDNDLSFGLHRDIVKAPRKNEISLIEPKPKNNPKLGVETFGYHLQGFAGSTASQKHIDPQIARDNALQEAYRQKMGIDNSNEYKNTHEGSSAFQLDLLANTPYIDKDLSRRILALNPQIIRDQYADMNSSLVSSLIDRLLQMQQIIKNTIAQAELEGRKYELDPDEWDDKVVEELLTANDDLTPKSFYLYRYVSLFHTSSKIKNIFLKKNKKIINQHQKKPKKQ